MVALHSWQASAAPRYAVIGYCWGGTTVFQHAVNGGTSGYCDGFVPTAVRKHLSGCR